MSHCSYERYMYWHRSCSCSNIALWIVTVRAIVVAVAFVVVFEMVTVRDIGLVIVIDVVVVLELLLAVRSAPPLVVSRSGSPTVHSRKPQIRRLRPRTKILRRL